MQNPLTEEEIAILTYWIDNAKGNFDAKVSEVETPDDITHIASSMLGLSGLAGAKDTDIA